MPRYLFLALAIAVALVGGCAPKPAEGPQTTVTVAPDVASPPPVPPKPETVMEAPKVAITKPSRDPFSPLVGEGKGSAGMPTIPEGEGPGGKEPTVKAPVIAAPQYRVAAIISNKEPTAVIESGSASWAVRRGDKIEQWTVTSVDRNQVVLKREKEEMKLKTPTGGG